MSNHNCFKLGILLVLLAGLFAVANGQSGPAVSVPAGTLTVVNNSIGHQTDPHVSGNWIVYVDAASDDGYSIHYYNLLTHLDGSIPRNGGQDALPDVNGNNVVYVHFADATTTAIYSFNLSTLAPPVELEPLVGSQRYQARIGGRTVAIQDFGLYGASLSAPKIVAYDLDTGTATQLTDDQLYDQDPAISPDGSAIVWTKCETVGINCAIWRATREASGVWTSSLLTFLESTVSNSALPDTNGQVVVFADVRTINGIPETDIYWQPLGGGPEHRITLPDGQRQPCISGNLISFGSEYLGQNNLPQLDIMVYDISNDTLSRITETPGSESLNDIAISEEGTVNVVWSILERDADNVYAYSYPLPLSDTIAPTTNAATSTLPNAAGWNNGNVTVTLDATDNTGGSGVKEINFSTLGAQVTANMKVNGATASLEITVEGITTVSYFAIDNAGNTETTKTLAIRLDKTVPNISISSPANHVYTLNQPVLAGFNCQDNGSGLFDCVGAVNNGTNVDTTAVGARTFQVNATDVAGNHAGKSVSFTVGYNILLLTDRDNVDDGDPRWRNQPQLCSVDQPCVWAGDDEQVNLQLVDFNNHNVSDATIPVHALGLFRIVDSNLVPVNSSRDFTFRARSNGRSLYRYELEGLRDGQYLLRFTSGTDPAVHALQFRVRHGMVAISGL